MDLNVQSINPEQIKALLYITFKADQPVLIHGAPGCGKSQLINEWAKENGYGITTRMLSQIQPSDLAIPYIDKDKGVLHWAITDWLVNIPQDKPHILFFDELPSAPNDVKVSIYQLLLEKRLGGFHLPKSTYIIAAGNRPSDMASAYELDTAIADRLTHLHVEVDPAQWLHWGSLNDLHPSVLSFIKLHPEQLDDSNSFNCVVRTSPRSWHKISDLLKVNSNPDQIYHLISGRVGIHATGLFLQYLQEFQQLPSIDLLLNSDLETVKTLIPPSISSLYALTFSLCAYCNTPEKMIKALLIIKSLCTIEDSLPRNDIMTMAFTVLLDKVQKKGWFIKLCSDVMYRTQIAPLVSSIVTITSSF